MLSFFEITKVSNRESSKLWRNSHSVSSTLISEVIHKATLEKCIYLESGKSLRWKLLEDIIDFIWN